MVSCMGGASLEREVKRGASVDGRVGPDAPAVAVDDALYDGQAHAGALIVLGAVQPLEDAEEFIGVLHVKTGAVVFHEIDALPVILPAADLDVRHGPLAAVFERV